jgi:hypothetical protein
MTASVAELASILRDAGLTVDTSLAQPGQDWPFSPVGLIMHHDAGGLGYNSKPDDDLAVPTEMAQKGNNGAQFWVRRTGVWYILSAGAKWHAGDGDGYGSIRPNNGNTDAYGIETDFGPSGGRTYGPIVPGDYQENGYSWPAWDPRQVQAIKVGSRALATVLGLNSFCGHREYAPDRKIDPAGNFDLAAWRKFITDPSPTPVPPTPDLIEEIENMTDAERKAFVDEIATAAAAKVWATVTPRHSAWKNNEQYAAAGRTALDTIAGAENNTAQLRAGN